MQLKIILHNLNLALSFTKTSLLLLFENFSESFALKLSSSAVEALAELAGMTE